ncbi:MAG: response regulator [Polyangiaceae bacterium]
MSQILLVDDDVDVRGTLGDLLADQGFQVATAANGAEALDYLQREASPPDLILLDIMMPVMGGVEFLHAYSSRRELPRVPVIVLTAFAVADIAGKSTHVVQCLHKPVDEATLLAAVLGACSDGWRQRRARSMRAAVASGNGGSAPPAKPGPSQRAARDASAPAVVLLVDDDEDIRESIAEFLRDDGYEVVGARNGAVAMDLIRGGLVPSVVLTDLMMPVMTGWELVARLRADENLASLPVIVTSAAADRAPPDSDKVLAKPLRLDLLIESVGELCRASRKGAEKRSVALQGLAQRNVELAEMQKFREEMSSLIVHDMKNPLMAIVTNLAYVLEEPLDITSEKNEALVDSREAAERLSRLVENLLHVVKLESGRFLPDRKETSAKQVLGGLARRGEALAREHGMSLDVVDPPDATLSIDVDLVSRALDNILDNAFRHTPRGGRIAVDALVTATQVAIRIGNTGTSIPPSSRRAIFDKYGQASAQAGRVNLGLGLYFCRLVAEAHGGSIAVEESASLPTIFTLRLPRS